MDGLSDFLINWGPWGMFLASLLSGSVVPFSSEAILIAMLAMGVNPWELLASASAGNILGGCTCYWMGMAGSSEWLERTFHIKHEKMERAKELVNKKGASMAFFGFVPLLGSAILITLGMMRANLFVTIISMAFGKFLRYLLIILPAVGITFWLAS